MTAMEDRASHRRWEPQLRLAEEQHQDELEVGFQPDNIGDLEHSDSDDDLNLYRPLGNSQKRPNKICSGAEKKWIGLTSVCVLVICALAAYIGVSHKQNELAYSSCLTPECVDLSARILKNMNFSVSPCNNFFKYACGNFAKNMVVPPGHRRWDYFSIIERDLKMIMKQLLEQDSNQVNGTNSTAVLKSHQFYKACMNKAVIEANGNEPILKLIRQVGASSIFKSDWDPGSWSFIDTMTSMHRMNMAPLFEWPVGADDMNNSINIIQLEQSGLSLDSEKRYLENTTLAENVRTAWVVMMEKMCILLGADAATTKKQVQEVHDFEISLAKVFVPVEELRDPRKIYNKMNLSTLEQLMPGQKLKMKEFLDVMLNRSMDLQESVIVYTPSYMSNLSVLLDQTEDRIIANYLMLQVLQELIPYLPSRFHDVWLDFSEVVSGVREERLQWQRCVSRSRGALGFALSAIYVEKHMTEKVRGQITTMIDDIAEVFKRNLATLDWMDADTMVKAEEKAKAMGKRIAYPDWILNVTRLDSFYENLTVTDDALKNFLNLRRFRFKHKTSKLHKKPNKKEWEMFPLEVNAYYSPNYNHISFLAGILRYPFYDPTFPKSLYYGGIGMIAGHEFTHGFDSMGSQYDKDGNMNQWWQKKTEDRFKSKGECMIKQYDDFKVAGKHVNGKFTLAENIADNGGMKLAWLAYKRWRNHADGEEEVVLPALNATHDQLFFIGAAQSWCEFATDQALVSSVLTNSHSPHEFRVIGPLSNTPQFAQAFNCPIGSGMNPKSKCFIW